MFSFSRSFFFRYAIFQHWLSHDYKSATIFTLKNPIINNFLKLSESSLDILYKVYFFCPKFHNIILGPIFIQILKVFRHWRFIFFPVGIRSYLQSGYPLPGQWYRLSYFSFLFFVAIWSSAVSRGIYELKKKFPYMHTNIFKFSEPILYS
jgi:hypothetical protein